MKCSEIVKRGPNKGHICGNESFGYEFHQCKYHLPYEDKMNFIDNGLLKRCQGFTKKGLQCTRLSDDQHYCSLHDPTILRPPTKKQIYDDLRKQGYICLSGLSKKQLEDQNFILTLKKRLFN